MLENDSSPSVSAEDVNIEEFFIDGPCHRRVFSSYRMSMMLNRLYGPFTYMNGRFYPIDRVMIANIIASILKEHFSTSRCNETLACMSELFYLEPSTIRPWGLFESGYNHTTRRNANHYQGGKQYA